MNKQPAADDGPKHDPDKVARRVPQRPDVFELRTGDARGNRDENGDENRSDRQSPEPNAPGNLRARDSRFHCAQGKLPKQIALSAHVKTIAMRIPRGIWFGGLAVRTI